MNQKKYNEYHTFLNRNFPNSYLTKNKYRDVLYSRIWENNVMTEIFEEKLKIRKDSCALTFLTAYREQITKLLIYFPLNDNTVVDFAIRCSVEYLLKLIYSIRFHSRESDLLIVSNKSYKKLKEELSSSFLKTSINDSLNDLFQKYGNYSNRVHAKSIDAEYELGYLQDVISSVGVDYSKFDKILINILDDFEIILSFLLLEDSYCLSTSKLLTLSKGIDSNRYLKIRENLFQTKKKVAGD